MKRDRQPHHQWHHILLTRGEEKFNSLHLSAITVLSTHISLRHRKREDSFRVYGKGALLIPV